MLSFTTHRAAHLGPRVLAVLGYLHTRGIAWLFFTDHGIGYGVLARTVDCSNNSLEAVYCTIFDWSWLICVYPRPLLLRQRRFS